jgi:hypothetical protein
VQRHQACWGCRHAEGYSTDTCPHGGGISANKLTGINRNGIPSDADPSGHQMGLFLFMDQSDFTHRIDVQVDQCLRGRSLQQLTQVLRRTGKADRADVA